MRKKEDPKLLREFVLLTRDILHAAEFKKMKGYQSHKHNTLYDHCVKVAFLCFKHSKRRGHADPAELVRGALLHDFYLYDLHGGEEVHRFHWLRHPSAALKNARQKYPALTRVQRDMIKHHMFPLTICPPRTRAGWLVCFYDKVAAVSDRFGKKKWRA